MAEAIMANPIRFFALILFLFGCLFLIPSSGSPGNGAEGASRKTLAVIEVDRRASVAVPPYNGTVAADLTNWRAFMDRQADPYWPWAAQRSG
jgi:hypothetical protein